MAPAWIGVRLGGAELRSNAGRYALIAVCALIAYAGEYSRFANAEPSTSGSTAGYPRLRVTAANNVPRSCTSTASRSCRRATATSRVIPSSSSLPAIRRALPQTTRAGSSANSITTILRPRTPTLDTDGDTRPALAVAPPETTGSISAPAISDMNVLPDVQPARSKGWDQELRRNASIQSKLRIEAGDRVFFSPGSAELGSRARNALAAQAKWLMRWHEFEAAIEGHADEPGTEQENVVLSEQRAEAVRERLIQEGIQPSRLAVVPLGRSIPVATCADTDCRAQNRRAVTLVFATGTRDRLGLVGSGSSRGASAALAVPSATVMRAVEVPGGRSACGRDALTRSA